MPRSDLNILEQLGEGQFGMVARGIARLDGSDVEVAVKFLKDDIDEVERRGLVLEAGKMAVFDSSHVVRLLAVCLLSRPNFLVLEYMCNGDLKTYLCGCGRLLSREHLLRLGLDASSGIAYLHEIKLVHRDVAARNVLLDGRFNAKIGDFGLIFH